MLSSCRPVSQSNGGLFFVPPVALAPLSTARRCHNDRCILWCCITTNHSGRPAHHRAAFFFACRLPRRDNPQVDRFAGHNHSVLDPESHSAPLPYRWLFLHVVTTLVSSRASRRLPLRHRILSLITRTLPLRRSLEVRGGFLCSCPPCCGSPSFNGSPRLRGGSHRHRLGPADHRAAPRHPNPSSDRAAAARAAASPRTLQGPGGQSRVIPVACG
jgi:hypothetical protein